MKKNLFVTGMLFLQIFQSCNNDELSLQNVTSTTEKSNTSRLAFDSKTLSGFVSNQLILQAQVKELLVVEKNVDYSMIQSGLQNVKTIEDIHLLYKNANITHGEELISLYKEMSLNAETFIKNNSDFYSKYNKEERLEIITKEIDSQLRYDDGLSSKVDCHTNFVKASNRCMRNYAISMTGVAVSGFFSFGVGTVVGGAVATTMMVACNSDADSDYHDCVKGGGQP